jgi:hypothetical protein
MGANTIFYGWKRSLPGREQMSASHFDDFMRYLAGLQKEGVIASFEPVFLDPSGAGMQGFVLIRTEVGQTGQLLGRPDFSEHIVRSMLHLDEPVLCCGVTGAMLRERMERWVANIPR